MFYNIEHMGIYKSFCIITHFFTHSDLYPDGTGYHIFSPIFFLWASDRVDDQELSIPFSPLRKICNYLYVRWNDYSKNSTSVILLELSKNISQVFQK